MTLMTSSVSPASNWLVVPNSGQMTMPPSPAGRPLAADAPNGVVDRRGVEIILKQLLDLMAKRGVAPIEALGADFDPNLHQAVAHEPSEAHRDGEVIEELRRGYTLRDRLLRASMVKVAKV